MNYLTKQIVIEVASTLRIEQKDRSFDAVRRRVLGRLAGLGIGPTCHRCLGSGHYSRNRWGSTQCYGCKGRGVTSPTSQSGWQVTLGEARVVAEDGRLDTYLDVLRGRAARKTASAAVLDAWKSTGISTRYSWSRAASEEGEDRRISRINFVMSHAEDDVSALLRSKEEADIAAIPAAVKTAIAIIQAAALLIDTDLRPSTLRAHVREGVVFIPCEGDVVAVVREGELDVQSVEDARAAWRKIVA